jgi:hypothetical protein
MMRTLKEKLWDCRTGDLTPCFYEKDVREAVSKLLKNQTDAIERLKYQVIDTSDYIIARQQNITEIKEIFGDFEE